MIARINGGAGVDEFRTAVWLQDHAVILIGNDCGVQLVLDTASRRFLRLLPCVHVIA